ncbi:MAG: DUF4124 domain-containing protein [Pseudomonadota bacterium]|nr:DUF4124 domain-containing protein [Pseudomonadota bacterium]
MAAALAAFAGQAAVVYKWTDDHGLVHYSDQPVPGAQKIVTASSSRSNGSGASAGAASPAAPSAKKPTASAINYTQFAITSPSPEQTYFGDEIVSVSLALQPALKEGQSITWHLNGKQLDDQGPGTTQFTLQSLERGAYVIAATILDQNTGESLSSETVNFYVRQPSVLSPQRKKP